MKRKLWMFILCFIKRLWNESGKKKNFLKKGTLQITPIEPFALLTRTRIRFSFWVDESQWAATRKVVNEGWSFFIPLLL